MENEKVCYSDILLEFIEPLLTGEEGDLGFLSVALKGQIAWNYALLESRNHSFSEYYQKKILGVLQIDPNQKELFEMLIIRKALKFSQYHHIISKVDLEYNVPNIKTLYLETLNLDLAK